MNIAYILNSTVSNGGATKSFMMMLRGVMNKGVTPFVIVPDTNGIYQDLVSLQIPVLPITFRTNSFPTVNSLKDIILFLPRLFARLIVNKRAIGKIVSFLSDKNIDIIHSNVSIITPGYQAARRLHLPHIFHIREYVDKDFNIHYIPSIHRLRNLLQSPSTYSICITKDIQRHHGLTESPKSRVIYNGIRPAAKDIPSFRKKGYLLYAGRIQSAKGITELLDSYLSYTKVTECPLPLYIAGGTVNKHFYASLLRFVESNHITHLVKFLGDRNDIELLMQEATAIVIPSRFEAFGRCMAEAMFNGCLVISKNTGGSKEQMDNGQQLEGGEIALRYNTSDELTLLLESVTKQNDIYQPYINRAFHAVNSLYASEINAEKVYQFYEDILYDKTH